LQPDNSTSTNYRGRFAPSPSGDLHFGSLVAAVGSYLEAKANRGEWLVRIEDLDLPRTVPGAADAILNTLEKHQMYWDQSIVFQSDRNNYYQEALELLTELDLLFGCECSRKQLKGAAIYPGKCRNKGLSLENHAIRIRTGSELISVDDMWQGRCSWNMASDIGDFIIRRSDGLHAYQLAVVVDDHLQGITHIVRGSDLLESTPRQICLQQQLNYTTPKYAHLPVAIDKTGNKLSKQHGAEPVDNNRATANILNALEFLGQNPPDSLTRYPLETIWEWALTHWSSNKSLGKPSIQV